MQAEGLAAAAQRVRLVQDRTASLEDAQAHIELAGQVDRLGLRERGKA